ncbi:amino acid ABC transporter substrate-binding protein [Variovorax dokdonensis]|uniref:Amino acid ABC transporter substrate-binding protein n=1 Tax=Variovorax dokdonensis TaxID=344883 RepID=A0ABT7N915_9BURK|nr:amino acid ABC transporter substrate-binding protein [Variovorax dokdonensis]MDM0044423.1 amino acid ABC transporter substrate-binding protein [Variovorax dokdonensis]
MTIDRRSFAAALGALGATTWWGSRAFAQPTGTPVRIGGSLALTGPLSSVGMVHKLTGEIYIDELNKRGGLLGRPVEWVLKDDQSKPDLTRTLYEQLVTSDKVDLLIGPYGTSAILSAMGVAQRYGKTLVHHTFGVPPLAKYDQQFYSWALGPEPQKTVPAIVFDALAAGNKAPKTLAVVTSKFPSVHFISMGVREVAKQRGIREVLFLEWDFGNRDFGPIAARIKDADPDLIWGGALGLEANQILDALKKIDYAPRSSFWYAPAPGPMLKAPEANNALSLTIFEDHPPFTNNPVAAHFTQVFRERATQANLPSNTVEVQAAASYSAWQIIDAAVSATKSLDDKAIATWLRANQVDTIQGKLRFNGPNNYGDDLSRVKQVQDGKWLVVHPKEWAAPGARLR